MSSYSVEIQPVFTGGKVEAPASKSMMIRVLAGAWLAGGKTLIHRPSLCRDALDVAEALAKLGNEVIKNSDVWEFRGGGVPEPGLEINTGESGLGARMFLALAAQYDFPVVVTGRGSLLRRPMKMALEPLQKLGVRISSANGKLPVSVQGPLAGGDITLDGSESSQFLTGLLMTLPLVQGRSRVRVLDLKSRPYVDLTLEVLNHFGVRIVETESSLFEIEGGQRYVPQDIAVEGDWSGAAFWLVAGAIAGDVTVTGLRQDSTQADKQILDALDGAGITMEVKSSELKILRAEKIKPFTFDLTHCPDLAPPLVALASCAEGESRLFGAGRLLVKESNRAMTLAEESARLGIRVQMEGDVLKIRGGDIEGGNVKAHNDHRIAMAAAVMALKAKSPVRIEGAGCVEKSYPQFFNDLVKLGGKANESIR